MLAKLVVQVIGSTLVVPLLSISVAVAGSTGAGALPITKFIVGKDCIPTGMIGAVDANAAVGNVAANTRPVARILIAFFIISLFLFKIFFLDVLYSLTHLVSELYTTLYNSTQPPTPEL